MEILYLIIAIIIVIYRKHKDIICKTIKKVAMRTAAVALSLILVFALVVSELMQRLLEKIGKAEQKMKGLDKPAKAGGETCS